MCNNRVLHFRKYKYNTFYTRPYGPISHFKCFYIKNEHARLIAILYKYTYYMLVGVYVGFLKYFCLRL